MAMRSDKQGRCGATVPSADQQNIWEIILKSDMLRLVLGWFVLDAGQTDRKFGHWLQFQCMSCRPRPGSLGSLLWQKAALWALVPPPAGFAGRFL